MDAERVNRTIKEDEVGLSEYHNFQDANDQIDRFIGEVYALKRIQSSLGYLTPAEFEQRWRADNHRELTCTPFEPDFSVQKTGSRTFQEVVSYHNKERERREEAMLCSRCQTPNPPGVRICRACGAQLSMPMAESFAVSSIWSLEQRTSVLQGAITRYVERGFRLMSQTATTAQLFKQRGVKGPAAVILLMFSLFGGAGVGAHLLVSYNLHLKDQNVYLSVDEMGNLYTRVAEVQEAGSNPLRILALAAVLAVISLVVIFGILLLSQMLSEVWGIR